MLNAVHEKSIYRSASRPAARGRLVSPTARAAVILAVVITLLGSGAGGLVVAAGNSLPGDLLYPVKRATEKAQRLLAFDPVSRRSLEDEFARRRYDEVRAVLNGGRPVTVEFEGSLEEIGEGFWVLGGLRVDLNAQTAIENRPAVGSTVSVRALLPGDGSILARYLRVRSELTPMKLPACTAPSPTATSTSRPVVPTATSSPEPTRPPELVATPKPVTDTPEPAETREPEPTEEPAETEEPESTPETESTETDEPESTKPKPTETAEPEPTDAVEPTDTDEPEPPPEPEPTDDD